jgi:hypothetical protein
MDGAFVALSNFVLQILMPTQVGLPRQHSAFHITLELCGSEPSMIRINGLQWWKILLEQAAVLTKLGLKWGLVLIRQTCVGLMHKLLATALVGRQIQEHLHLLQTPFAVDANRPKQAKLCTNTVFALPPRQRQIVSNLVTQTIRRSRSLVHPAGIIARKAVHLLAKDGVCVPLSNSVLQIVMPTQVGLPRQHSAFHTTLVLCGIEPSTIRINGLQWWKILLY